MRIIRVHPRLFTVEVPYNYNYTPDSYKLVISPSLTGWAVRGMNGKNANFTTLQEAMREASHIVRSALRVIQLQNLGTSSRLSL